MPICSQSVSQTLSMYTILSARKGHIKNNNRYYKPNSLPAAGVGGSCNRALLNYKKRRT